MHFTLGAMIISFLFGIYLAMIYERFGLIASIGCHMLYNVCAFLFGWIFYGEDIRYIFIVGVLLAVVLVYKSFKYGFDSYILNVNKI